MATVRMTLKLLIDKKTNKVLFAEARKDFVDFLFSFLSLPLGSAIKLLTNEQIVSSIGNVYQSVKNISDNHLENKEMLLNPKAPASSAHHPFIVKEKPKPTKTYYMCSTYNMNFISNKGPCGFCGCEKKKKLKNVKSTKTKYVSSGKKSNSWRSTSPQTTYYDCGRQAPDSSHLYPYLTDNPATVCPTCGLSMSTEVTNLSSHDDIKNAACNGYAKGIMPYLVMDDLVVMPMSTLSCISLLKKFDIENVSLLEERLVDFGMDQALELLKACLQSKTALSDVFIGSK